MLLAIHLLLLLLLILLQLLCRSWRVCILPLSAHLLHILLHLEVLPVHKNAVIPQQCPVLPAVAKAGRNIPEVVSVIYFTPG